MAAFSLDAPHFLNYEFASRIDDAYGTPTYVYDENVLKRQATSAMNFPNAFGLKVCLHLL